MVKALEEIRIEHLDRRQWQRASREHFARVASAYDQGRAFERGQFWAREIASRVELSRLDWLLDLGCGTGLFAVPFAHLLPCRVVGLDPSPAMVAAGRAKANGAPVFWIEAEGEQVPFAPEIFKAIFLSQVWHHLQDSTAAAREFCRILVTGGQLFIKTYSHAQLLGRWDLVEIFPELMPFMLEIYPDVPELTAVLSDAGFTHVSCQDYCWPDSTHPSALLRVAEGKLWSMFAYISEPGRQAGMERLRQLIMDTGDAPLPDPEMHLLVTAGK